MSSVTRIILRQIESLGFTVEAGTVSYRVRMVATAQDGQRHIVDAEDEYTAACALAGLVGIEIDDG